MRLHQGRLWPRQEVQGRGRGQDVSLRLSPLAGRRRTSLQGGGVGNCPHLQEQEGLWVWDFSPLLDTHLDSAVGTIPHLPLLPDHRAFPPAPAKVVSRGVQAAAPAPGFPETSAARGHVATLAVTSRVAAPSHQVAGGCLSFCHSVACLRGLPGPRRAWDGRCVDGPLAAVVWRTPALLETVGQIDSSPPLWHSRTGRPGLQVHAIAREPQVDS
nr:uncharacterized protein LOC114090932 [Marmota flaviventris]